jgi:oxygen-independent coproporphyrinogen-3 oxidase
MTGLYIHIPFCKKKCPYCGFFSTTNINEELIEDYLNSIIKEAEARCVDYTFDTIYIGGGTPSVLPLNLLETFLNKLLNIIKDPIIEFTVEVNPESVSAELIKVFYNHNVTRLSVGAQSFDDDVLILLGRIHNSVLIYKALENILKLYNTSQINIDLIYDIPLVPVKKITSSIKKVAGLNIGHISAYSFSHDTNFLIHFEEAFKEQFLLVKKLLTASDYEKYEISNFSKKGLNCIHNIKYWQMEDYIGLGVSAHSMQNKGSHRVRIANTNNIENYINNPLANNSTEYVDLNDMVKESVIFGLRYLKGINLKNIKKLKSNHSIFNKINYLIEQDYLKLDEDNLALTEKGELFYNYCAQELWQ